MLFKVNYSLFKLFVRFVLVEFGVFIWVGFFFNVEINLKILFFMIKWNKLFLKWIIFI